MKNSNANATRLSWTARSPGRAAWKNPSVNAIKDALPNLVGITTGKRLSFRDVVEDAGFPHATLSLHAQKPSP
ncbi:hypothetical protein ABIB82_002280 [Bradyrhizobium sp. i1.8.4]|uniref:hypothetical protein n=1 Tax=unclassified Bradyrhizobium TaxID=2631580 RepID=UPI003D1E4F0F